MVISTSPLSILLAGSSTYTLQLAKALRTDSRFQITGVVTPAPQPIGRQKTLTPSPVQLWAKQEQIAIILIPEKIDQRVKKQVIEHTNTSKCDILLVVDFGYFVPNWLLALPQIGPVNVHPSLLPRWRGSSPAQRVLLAGEPTSAVSVIRMSDILDAGDLITQLPFEVNPNWDSQAYYEFAFNLLAPQLGTILAKFATGALVPQPQPVDTLTPMADRLTKADSYLPWHWVVEACGWATDTQNSHSTRDTQTTRNSTLLLSQIPDQAPQTGLLQDLASDLSIVERAKLFARASRAFSPWPKLWTFLPTAKGWQRLIIWQTSFNQQTQKLKLNQVQLEGKQPSSWNEIKNNWQSS